MGSSGGGGIGIPLPPKYLKATVLSGRKIGLTWSEDASGADPQAFYVDIGKNPGGTELGSTSVPLQKFTAGSLWRRNVLHPCAGVEQPGRERGQQRSASLP